MKRALPAELEPAGVTPCFCASCMKAGGAARELLRQQWRASALRMLLRVPTERPPRQRRRRRVSKIRDVQPVEPDARAPFADPRVLARVVGVAAQKAGAR